jgi:hypothetical protein
MLYNISGSPLAITSVYPADDATDVPVTALLSATFNRDVVAPGVSKNATLNSSAGVEETWDLSAAVPATVSEYAIASATSANITIGTSDSSDVLIDWGDGDFSVAAHNVQATHNYDSAYTGTIKVFTTATITRWDSSAAGWSFALSALKEGLTYFRCTADNSITGTITDIPNSVGIFQLYGQSSLSGDLADSNANLTFFLCLGGFNTVFVSNGATPAQTSMRYVYIQGVGLSAAEVDDVLIFLAQISTWTNEKIVNLAGNNAPRTSASDTAVSTLQGYGVTVTTSS